MCFVCVLYTTAKIRRSVPDRVGLTDYSAVIIPLFNDFIFHNSADCFLRISVHMQNIL